MDPPLNNLEAIGFLSNSGPDPLGNYKLKLPSQHLMLGHHWLVSKKPFCWRADDGTLLVVLDHLSPHQLKTSVVRVTPILGFCYCSMVCCTLLYVHSSIAIILMGKRELVALLNLSSWCLVMVERLFLAVPRGCLRFVIVVFRDHTHLLFFRWNPFWKTFLICA